MKSRFGLDLLIIFKWMQDLKKAETRTIENEKPRSHLILLRCLNFKKNLQNLEKMYMFSISTLKQKLIDKSLGLLLWKMDGFPIHHILAQQTQLRNWREWLSSSDGKEVLCIYILLSTQSLHETNQFMHEHPINLSMSFQFVYTQIPSVHMNSQLAHTSS